MLSSFAHEAFPNVQSLLEPTSPEAFKAVAEQSHYSDHLIALYGQLELHVAYSMSKGRPEAVEESDAMRIDRANYQPKDTLYVFSRINTKTPEKILETARYMMVHSYILSGEAIHVRELLPTIADPNYKSALFYTAVATAQSSEQDSYAYNLASLEVLTAYDMGNELETELQKSSDKINLSRVLLTKIAGGFDPFSNVEKLLLLKSTMKPPHSYDERYLTSAVAKLVQNGNYEEAKKLYASSPIKKRELAYISALQLATEPENISNRERKNRIAEIVNEAFEAGLPIDQGEASKVLKNLMLRTHSITGQIYLESGDLEKWKNLQSFCAELNSKIIAPGLRGAVSKGDPVYNVGNAGSLASNASNASSRLLEIDLDHATYPNVEFVETIYEAMIDNHVSEKLVGTNAVDSIIQMMRLAGELVATRYEPIASSGISASVYGKLEPLEEERTPSKQHHLMVDYYAREEGAKAEADILAECLEMIRKPGSKLDKLTASRKLAEFALSSFYNHTHKDKNEERTIIEQINDSFAAAKEDVTHPFLLSLIGDEAVVEDL